MDYVFAKLQPGAKAARMKTLQNVDDTFELLRGVSRAQGFPDDAQFQMNDAFPDSLQLEDFIFNRNKFLLVSAKVKDIVEQHGAPKTEFLPVAILNHKGRREKAPYFVLNQIGLVDCIDRKRSDADENPIDRDLFIVVKKLVLDEKKIPKDLTLFRMKHYPMAAVLRRDLAERLAKEKCSGFGTVEVDAFTDP